ncbi:MAG: hypothetical protein P1U56_21440 [Saprospiraceae bacterium]|nr:hypothetical protein [Saprospiraceae bacterium]
MENPILDRIKNQAKSLRTLAEELQVQMALGKAEARDVIEQERKNLSSYINKQKQEMAKAENEAQESRREFLTCVEDLETALFNEVPEESAAYDIYKNDILTKVYKLEEEIRDNMTEMSGEIQENLESFKSKMDAFRVNLALHDKDNPEQVEKIRNEFTERLSSIREILNKKENAQSKLDSFVEDISESFSYLKRAIADLSN